MSKRYLYKERNGDLCIREWITDLPPPYDSYPGRMGYFEYTVRGGEVHVGHWECCESTMCAWGDIITAEEADRLMPGLDAARADAMIKATLKAEEKREHLKVQAALKAWFTSCQPPRPPASPRPPTR